MPGTGPKPSLTIPVMLDAGEALRVLDQLGPQLKKAGDDASESFDGAGKSLRTFGGLLTDIASHQGLALLKEAAQGLSRGMEETVQHISKITSEFTQLREAMRGIMALQGQAPTDQATLGQIELSAKSQILSPQEFAAAQESFLQYGSGYVSKPGQPGRIEQSTVDEILPQVMGYAKARKVSPEVASKLISALIQTMPKGSSAEAYMDMFSKVMEIAETSKGSATTTLSQLAPLLAEGIGEGMAFGTGPDAVLQAARLVAVEQERNPEEAFTYSRALLQELHHIHGKKGAEQALGITADMTVEQKVRAIGEAYSKSGVGSFADFIEPLAGDKIRGTGALQTALNQGVTGGMFDTLTSASAGVDRSALAGRMQEFLSSEGGAYMTAQAANERAQAEAGVKFAEMAQLKLEAETQLNREGRFENMTGWGDTLRGVGAQLGAPSIKQQLVNERAVQLAYQQAGETQRGLGNMGDSQFVIDKEILETLKRANEQRAVGQQKTLSAPPPKSTYRTDSGEGGW